MASKFTRNGVSLNVLRRHFSSSQSSTANHQLFFVCNDPEEVQNESFPDSKDFPLPGHASSSYQYRLQSYVTGRQVKAWQKVSEAVLSSRLTSERQVNALLQFVTPFSPDEPISLEKEDELLDDVIDENTSLSLAVTAQTCPEILKRQFSDLFPEMSNSASMGRPIYVGYKPFDNDDEDDLNSSTLVTGGFNQGDGGLTVINIVQRTDNDMAYWSKSMETERDKLTSDFINMASSMCDALEKSGYWANFIDPSTGRPYMGPFTSATLFDTDERYRYFGFQIDDLGCCKVVKHPDYGTKAFTGTIFTNAPLHSPRMNSLLNRINAAGRQKMRKQQTGDTALNDEVSSVLSGSGGSGSCSGSRLRSAASSSGSAQNQSSSSAITGSSNSNNTKKRRRRDADKV